MELNRQTAELALKEASQSNPGEWVDHSQYVRPVRISHSAVSIYRPIRLIYLGFCTM